jgi:hypothetical protein
LYFINISLITDKQYIMKAPLQYNRKQHKSFRYLKQILTWAKMSVSIEFKTTWHK